MVSRFSPMRILSLAALGALLAGQVAAETYQIDAVHSPVNFTIRHLVSRVSGRFTDFAGTVYYDAEHPEKLAAEATIQVTSINTDNERRDNHLRSADFFAVEKFPTITFKSTKAEKKGDKLMLTGEFTMHGVTKTIILPVEVLGTGLHPMSQKPQIGLATEITLLRSDYGITNWVNAAAVLGDEVKVSIAVEANAQ